MGEHRDKGRAPEKLAAQGYERGGPGDSWGKCRGWEDMAQVCRSLYVRLVDGNDSTTNALGYNGPDTKGVRGVPRDWADGTNMEGPGEDHGPQIGDDCAT